VHTAPDSRGKPAAPWVAAEDIELVCSRLDEEEEEEEDEEERS